MAKACVNLQQCCSIDLSRLLKMPILEALLTCHYQVLDMWRVQLRSVFLIKFKFKWPPVAKVTVLDGKDL